MKEQREKIENPVVVLHKRKTSDSYGVSVTNDSQNFHDGLLIASMSPDEADSSFAVFSMVGYYMAAEIEKLRSENAVFAAENAGLKAAIPSQRNVEFDNDSMDDISLAEDVGFNDAIGRMKMNMSKTPATEAFLAEVRAQGVEMFSERFGGGTLLSDMVKEAAKEFAAQLRKGAQS